MSLLTFRSLWGMSSKDWETEFSTIKANGFDGIEASLADVGLPNDKAQFKRFCDLMENNGLKWICGLYTGWTDYEFGKWKAKSVAEHIDQFRDQVSIIKSLESNQLPIHINCHTGCDSFTESQAVECLESILEEGRKLTISHETHRGRILGTPWVCLRMIEKFKDLRITLDISHWTVVSERLIPIELLDPLFSRVDHIHARIGTHEAPQVGNPRSQNIKLFTEYHEQVWKSVWASCKKQVCTVTPEYGPVQDFYMPQIIKSGKDGTEEKYVEVELTMLILDEEKKLRDLFKNKNL